MKVLVALAGGGFRALHHLPMLRALKAFNLEVAGIAGTSYGAVVAAAVAAGRTDEEILQAMARGLPLYKMRPSFKDGILSTSVIARICEKLCGNYTLIEQLPLPTWICATDMLTGQPKYFSAGPIGKLAGASSAVPVLFAPDQYQNYLLADGGLTAIIPVEPLQSYQKEHQFIFPIIGLHCNHYPIGKPITGLRSMGERAGQLMLSRHASFASAPACDLYLSPPNAGLYSMASVKGALKTLDQTEAYAHQEVEKWIGSRPQIG